MPMTAEPAAPFAPSAPHASPPLSVGRLLGRSFSVWFANFVPFSIVTLVFYVPSILLAAFTEQQVGSAWELLDRLLSALSQYVVTGALTSGVLVSLRGGRASTAALLGSGFRNLGAVFATGLRVGLWLVLGVVLLVVPALMWYCALFVAVPAAVAEPGLGSSADALQRSRELTDGSRWQIFAAAVVVIVTTFLLFFLAGAAGALAEPLGPRVVAVLVAVVVALAGTLGACTAAVAYHDLRTAREGVSTEDLAKVFE